MFEVLDGLRGLEDLQHNAVDEFFEKLDFSHFERTDTVAFLVDQDQHSCNHGKVEHVLDGIGIVAYKVRQVHFLFHETEKHLDVPPLAINFSDGHSR